MRNEFYVECYLQGPSGAVKLCELACDRTAASRARLAAILSTTYRAEDAGKIELKVRKVTAEDAVGVSKGLAGAVEDAWWAACRGLLQ